MRTGRYTDGAGKERKASAFEARAQVRNDLVAETEQIQGVCCRRPPGQLSIHRRRLSQVRMILFDAIIIPEMNADMGDLSRQRLHYLLGQVHAALFSMLNLNTD